MNKNKQLVINTTNPDFINSNGNEIIDVAFLRKCVEISGITSAARLTLDYKDIVAFGSDWDICDAIGYVNYLSNYIKAVPGAGCNVLQAIPSGKQLYGKVGGVYNSPPPSKTFGAVQKSAATKQKIIWR